MKAAACCCINVKIQLLKCVLKSWSAIEKMYSKCIQLHIIFMRESSYCFQCVLAIAILSVRPSVTWVDQSKTVQARITKSSPSAAWKTLVSGTVKLFHKFEGGHP